MDQSSFSDAPTPEELARYDLTDYGNAMRLIRLAGGALGDDDVDTRHVRLLHIMGMGWIGFNGQFWDQKFGEVLARRMAHAVGQKMRDPNVRPHLVDMHALAPPDYRKYIDSLGSAGATSAMLKQAQSYLTVEIDAFDNHPMLLNVRNGTLSIGLDEGGQVKVVKRPHSPADRLTRMAQVDYDPKAQAPLFRKVWRNSLDVEEIAAFFQRLCGYAATGLVYEQAFAICQGKGRDGKSTLLDAQREMLGGYGGVGDINTFLENGATVASGASPDLIKLAGDTRFVVLSEPKRGAKFDEGRLKAWTSGSPITARQLREAPIDFRPKGKLIIECNALPIVRGDDDGIWRRAHVIPFENQVPMDQVDKQLPRKLRAEFPGILNWVIEGIGEWLKQGLAPPASLKKVLEDYRKESSPFGDWLISRCVIGKDAGEARTLCKELHDDYKLWCEEQGQDPKQVMSVRMFGLALSQRQIRTAGKNAKGLQFRGPIRLKTPAEIDADIAASADQSGAASATLRGMDGSDPLGMDDDPFGNGG